MWVESAPLLNGDLNRYIGFYQAAVPLQAGESLLSDLIRTEAGTEYTFFNLDSDTAYEFQIRAWIYTEWQGVVVFDIGTPPVYGRTCKKYFLLSNILKMLMIKFILVFRTYFGIKKEKWISTAKIRW